MRGGWGGGLPQHAFIGLYGLLPLEELLQLQHSCEDLERVFDCFLDLVTASLSDEQEDFGEADVDAEASEDELEGRFCLDLGMFNYSFVWIYFIFL